MGIERIAGTGLFEVIFQSLARRLGTDSRVHGGGLARRGAVFPSQHIVQGAGLGTGGAWVKLKAAPDYLNIIAVRETGQRRLESPFPDIAPWADDVRPDFYVHCCAPSIPLSADKAACSALPLP
jgi:hypothetical protein